MRIDPSTVSPPPSQPATPHPGRHRRSGAVGALLFMTASVAGCGDLVMDPGVRALALEARASLDFRGELPALPGLVDKAGPSEGLEELVAAWEESWRLPGEEGARVRARIHREAVPAVVPSLDPESLEDSLDRLARSLTRAEELDRGGLPDDLLNGLDRARDREKAARNAHAERRWQDTLEAILEGADHLWEFTPEVVARRVVSEADSAIRRAGNDLGPGAGGVGAGHGPAGSAPSAKVPSETLERAMRLHRGARHALERGEYERAIRRAYYVRHLLEEVEP